MECGELDAMRKYPHWAYFASLTFKREPSSPHYVTRKTIQWLTEVATFCGISISRLIWAVRVERGDKYGRLHSHALIGSVKPSRDNSFVLQKLWRNGIARVRVFDGRTEGIEYLGESHANVGTRPENAHEIRRYNLARGELTLSTSLQLWLASRGGLRLDSLPLGQPKLREDQECDCGNGA